MKIYKGGSVLIDNSSSGTANNRRYTKSYYTAPDLKGETFDINWETPFELESYSSIKIVHYTNNPYASLGSGYRAPHIISNYKITVTFSKS